MDAALHAELGGAELDRVDDPRREVLLGDLVGVGRALALAEAAEGAADDADVGEVDVAVDDEGDPVAGQLGPQLVGGDPHLLDHLGPGLGEQRRQLVLGQLLALAPLGDRRLGQPRRQRLFAPPPGPPPRDEAPVLQLDHVEDPLLHPLRVHVLRIDAEPLGQRVPLRRQLLPHLMRTRKRLLRRDVVPVRRQPTQVSRPRFHQLRPPIRKVRRDLHAHIRHQPLALLDQPLDLLDPNRARPLRHRQLASPCVGDGDDPARASPSVAREGSSPSPAHRSREAASAMSATSAP